MDGVHGAQTQRDWLAELDSLVLRILRLRYRQGERAAAAEAIAATEEDILLAALRRARRLEVGPLFAREVLRLDLVPAAMRHEASQLYRENLARNLFLKAETDAWVSALHEAGIPCRILKGVYMSELLYEDLGAKTCADIDIFVRREDLDRALKVASTRGFSPASPAADGPSDPSAKAYTLISVDRSAPYSVDLHWNLEVPMVISVNHADLWGDPCESWTAGPASTTLPADLLGALLCLHLWRHNMSLKALVDFAAFVHRFEGTIPAIRDRFSRIHAEDGLTVALCLASRCLGVPFRDTKLRFVKRMFLPWLEFCTHLSAEARGHYLNVLVSPLRFDGAWRPITATLGYLFRSGYSDGRPRIGDRVKRVVGSMARATSVPNRFTRREADRVHIG